MYCSIAGLRWPAISEQKIWRRRRYLTHSEADGSWALRLVMTYSISQTRDDGDLRTLGGMSTV